MVYASGRTDHTISEEKLVDHLVELVETKAQQVEAEIQAAKLAAQ